MSRIDVLFQMTQIIRSRSFTTAAYLSQRLNISTRTVYRYINELSLAGIPITSQTGKGYWIDKHFDMPPIHLSAEELMALSFGCRLVKASADTFLADAAQQVLDKVEAVIPRSHQQLLHQLSIHAPTPLISKPVANKLGQIRKAVESQNKVEIEYEDERSQSTQRVIWPLATAFWGRAWTVAAWCETRNAFRAFRIDRMQRLTVLNTQYPKHPGRTIDDFIAQQSH